MPFRRIREHERRLADGQQASHVTLPLADRFRGSLDGVPSRYRHQTCGHITEMPEDIARSYLANPFLYNDKSFCSGCGEYVSIGSLQWVETGETLLAHDRRMKADYLRKHGLPPCQ